MNTDEQNPAEELNPLQSIQDRNQAALDQLNQFLAATLGHKLGRIMSSGASILLEYVLYAFALCVFLFIFMIEKVSPFYLLAQMRQMEVVQDALNPHIIASFTTVVKSMVGVIAFLILLIALLLRRSRLRKNSSQAAIIGLRSAAEKLVANNNQLLELDKLSGKIFEAANVVANEANIK